MKPDLFKYMNNICFKDYESFTKHIDNDRGEMLDVDYDLLCAEPKEVDIENFQDLPNGRIWSEYKGYRFESFFIKKKVSICMFFSMEP